MKRLTKMDVRRAQNMRRGGATLQAIAEEFDMSVGGIRLYLCAGARKANYHAHAAYREANREKLRAYQVKYRAKNAEKIKEYTKAYRSRKKEE